MHTLDQLRSGELAGAARLDLSCGLTEFPREIFALAESLEILNLSGNLLETLPEDLPRLHKLRILFCSDNRFTRMPPMLGQCGQLSMVGFKANQIEEVPGSALPPALRWLILTDNRIEHLPRELGDCAVLQKLMLSGNRLADLPQTMAACAGLEMLRLAANQFQTLPDWLLSLPRLAWLAFAGNPGVVTPTVLASEWPCVAWRDLRLTQQLGEGASGVIHRARWQQDQSVSAEEVAVKIFKGAVTSDGLPEWEMAAALAAGKQPHLIPLRGVLTGHPSNAVGLVMDLIDPACVALAGPPSFATCTRDVYPGGSAFSMEAVAGLARGLASAAAHLHARGILHGDFYAHNVLWNPASGHGYLGDFGAASFYDRDSSHAQRVERIEVLAFGHLLNELLQHTQPDPAHASVPARLSEVAAACCQSNIGERPLFAEIVGALAQTI